MVRSRWLVTPILTAIVLMSAAIRAQDDDDEDEFVQLPLGLVAEYQAADGTALLRRMEPMPRLYGTPRDSVHPRLPGDAFRARWQGCLLVPYDGQYTFWWDGTSLANVRLTLAGEAIEPGRPVELEFGNVPLELTGVQGKGETRLEFTWRGETFARERIAPRFFGHRPKAAEDPTLERQAVEDSGAALAEEFGCFRCHEGPTAWTTSLGEDLHPAVLLPGPQLSGVGRRAHGRWLHDYLADPAAHRPGTRMPAQFGDRPEDRLALRTIAEYLGSGQTAEVAEARPSGSLEAGQKLYDSLGCAACHEPPDGSVDASGVPLRVPSLDRLAEKWTVPGLAEFLRSPLVARPHGRMPDFALSPRQADDLVAYLLGREKAGAAPQFVALPKPDKPAPSDVRGLVDPTGLMLLMAFDQSEATVSDQSGQDHHGKRSGGAGHSQEGHPGASMRFQGNDGQVVIEGSERFPVDGDFTWSAWIKTKADGAVIARSAAKGKWVPGGKVLFLRGGRLTFDVGWVGAVAGKNRIDDDRWHHVAAVVRVNVRGDCDAVTLYVDGHQEALRDDWDIHRRPEKDYVLKIGRASNNFPQNHGFNGLVDEVSAWSRALGPAEILAVSQGDSHLAATEAARFAPGELESQWQALGEDPAVLARLAAGMKLQAVAIRQMAAYGCVACHEVGSGSLLTIERRASGAPQLTPAARAPDAPPLDRVATGRLGAGCLASDASRGGAPRFDFSADERAALTAYVASLPSRSRPSAPEVTALDVKLLGCTACHENEGSGGGPLVALLGGRQQAQFITPPSLTGVAARLRPERLDEYLRDGTRFHRMRPWLAAHMPGFGDRGRRLAVALCRRDGVSLPAVEKEKPQKDQPAIPQNQVDLGRLLVSNKGLTCVNCHAVGEHKPSGEVDPSTQSPDLALVTDHVRRDYFERLVHNPDRFFPGTKMPVIIPTDGPAPVPALADVPEETLVTALWSYMSLGPNAPPPLEEDPAVALPNIYRAYVQRGPTYVGDRLFGRGITCGFPSGTLLFDADTLEPAATWFDGFLLRVPTNYFGLNWRVPTPHEVFVGQRHSLVFQKPGNAPWHEPPLPLECDPNTASRFDGYTTGRHDVTFRYRLGFDNRQIPVVDRLRIDRNEPWRGYVRELTVGPLSDGARAAWTLPAGEDYRFFAGDGAPVAEPAATADAPIAVTRSGRRVVAFRVEGPPGAQWQVDTATGVVRLVGPEAADGRPLRWRVGRWSFATAGREPTAAELAVLSLGDEAAAVDDNVQGEDAAGDSRPLNGRGDAPAEEPFAYKIEPIPGPPGGWRPSGTCFTSDGMLYACGLTEGRVYRTKIPPVPAPKKVDWELFATGLNIPTGMNVVDDRIFVAHRPEVTELIDADRDGTAETFRTLMGPWSLKDGFHEYAFGLAVDPQKRFYVGLNNGYFWKYGGPTNRGRHRSDVMRCDLDGHSEQFGHGCRVPNGICQGPDGQIFFVDNQGDWIQVCKLVHCRKGVFYGHPETEAEFPPEGQVPDGLPAVWIPYTVIRSAAALRLDDTGGRFGPFAGQIFVGDTGYGQSVNIMRMALEQVDGVWQGAAFRFIDGPPRGPQHTTFGPDGAMYVSCLTDGIVRIRYGGLAPMEIHHVAMRRDGQGFVLHFTKPLAAEADVSPQTIRARRWYYPYGIRYGSPRVDEVDVPIEATSVSADRRSIDLKLPIKTYKNCMVYYFNVGHLRSADGQEVGHPEAWYTVQRVWKP